MTKLSFQYGTLVLTGGQPPEELRPLFTLDGRVAAWRAEARHYATIFGYYFQHQEKLEDAARAYSPLPVKLNSERSPRAYQQEALSAWLKNQRRGIVVLPTGTGKSFLAMLAIAACQRSTLVVAPTIDLMEQWSTQLQQAFQIPVAMLGGGSKEHGPLTVSTYDSAVLQMEHLGNQFGLLVVDECHHLPGPAYQQLARMCLAPYRLGLTATPEGSADNTEVAMNTMQELLGNVCFRREIDEMEGEFLAPYQTETIPVLLDDDEFAEYDVNRRIYLDFLHRFSVNLSRHDGWAQFIYTCARQPGGREALQAYMKQRTIARNCRDKYRKIWQLIVKHRRDRIIIFTADNATAYTIGDRYGLPVITHHTRVTERHEMLQAFRHGDYGVLVTSKVLNEGVDVPEANIGIVVSGSGSAREHVQRLGRILRRADGKTAILYELVSAGTSEWSVSERRRQHRAYERPDTM